MLKKKYAYRVLSILVVLMVLLLLGVLHDSNIEKKTRLLCLEGRLVLGKVVSIYEPFRKERVDFEIEYEVNGEKCSNGKYLFYYDDLIWVIYNKDKPESSRAFYKIAEQYDYKDKYINELDISDRFAEMAAYVEQCNCVPDSLMEVSYYGFLRPFLEE